MKAPEKIYLQENTTTDCYGEFWPEWFEARAKETDIEYIRTDAFIEQVEKYLQEHLIDYWSQSVTDESKFIEDFKNYMKGE